VAHTIALISLFSGKAVPPTIAMTVSSGPFYDLLFSLTLFRVKCHFEDESLQSEALRKSSSVLSELVLRQYFYLLKIEKSKIRTFPPFWTKR
jgi:hypothetical protein